MLFLCEYSLNCLIKHQRFLYLLYVTKSYFSDIIASGIVNRNEIIDLAGAVTGMLGQAAQNRAVQGRKRSYEGYNGGVCYFGCKDGK